MKNKQNPTLIIEEQEVVAAINKLKNRKASRKDTISNELIKCSKESLKEDRTKFFSKVLQSRKVPEDWKWSIIIPNFKIENNKGAH